MNNTYVPVLTIAGSDCSGGAGLQADIKTISALGGYAASVVTAVTVQNTCGVQSVYPIPAEVVKAQIEAVMSDIHPLAVKIGMVNDAKVVKAIAICLRKHKPKWIVLDPVMVSTSGHSLITESARDALVKELIPLASIITPNLPEAEVLMHHYLHIKSHSFNEMALQLKALGCKAVLLKGGHLEGDCLQDCLVLEDELQIYPNKRIDTCNTHGTGCTLSSAIATELALGKSLMASVDAAEEYLHKALFHGAMVKVGDGHGPVNFFYQPHSSVLVPTTPFRVIVITSPEDLPNEAEKLNALFAAGLQCLHLRKPHATEEAIAQLLQGIESTYRKRIVLHDAFDLAIPFGVGGVHLNSRNPTPPPSFCGSISCSCHSFDEVKEAKKRCNYVSLSPLFDSTSKSGYHAAFTSEQLIEAKTANIIDEQVMALSGITPDNLLKVRQMGFGGAMVLGYIWQTRDGNNDGSEAVERFTRFCF